MKNKTKTTKSHATKSTTAAATPTAVTHAAAGETVAVATTATTTAPQATPAKSPVASIPTEEQITQWVNSLDGVRAMLGDAATPLTTQERRRALRARKGGEATVGLMIGLGQQYGVNLPGIDPAQIQQHSLLVTRLQPLETKLRVIAGLVTDTVANSKTESWQGTTALYTALIRASARNAALQKELKPAVAFFKKPKASTGAPKASTKTSKQGTVSATPTEPVTATPVVVAPEPVAPAAPEPAAAAAAAVTAPTATKQ